MQDVKTIESSLTILDFAQGLPADILIERSNLDNYPSAIGEHIVAYALGLLLPHAWDDDELSSLADRITEPLSQLDTGIDKANVWQELFRVAAEVRTSLEE